MKTIKKEKVIRYEEIEVYSCDYCGEELEGTHISIVFGGWSGYVSKQADGKWKHVRNCITPYHNDDPKQFCDGVCINGYFLRAK